MRVLQQRWLNSFILLWVKLPIFQDASNHDRGCCSKKNATCYANMPRHMKSYPIAVGKYWLSYSSALWFLWDLGPVDGSPNGSAYGGRFKN